METNLQAVGIPHVFALAVTAVCAVTDLRTGRIYNIVTVPAMALALAWHLATGGGGALLSGAAGLAAGLIPFALASARGWIGGGDVKLFGAVGATLGALLLLDILLVTFVTAALYGSILLVYREGVGGAARRFAAGLRMILRGAAARPDPADDAPALRLGVFVFIGSLTVVIFRSY